MQNQNKFNIELAFSTTFFVAGIIWFFRNPFGAVRDLVPGFYPIFYNVTIVMIVGLFFFLGCSIYAGALSLKKASKNDDKRTFGFVPKNIPGWLALIQILISLGYAVLAVVYIFF